MACFVIREESSGQRGFYFMDLLALERQAWSMRWLENAKLILLPSVHRAYAGESERILREAFANAASEAATGRPAIIFIDEVDTMCPPRDSRRQQETRLVAQLLTLMDGIGSSRGSSSNPSRVVVVAATNRVNAIDPALRRPGRFDREIAVAPPSIQGRYEILCVSSLA